MPGGFQAYKTNVVRPAHGRLSVYQTIKGITHSVEPELSNNWGEENQCLRGRSYLPSGLTGHCSLSCLVLVERPIDSLNLIFKPLNK
jgi:hypothetical protein